MMTRQALGTTLSVATAVLITAHAVSAPRKPYKARDLVPATSDIQSGLSLVCRMYPDECRFNADGSVARVTGRKVTPGPDRTVLRHFQTEVGTVQGSPWGPQ